MVLMPASHLKPAEHEGPSLWPGTPRVCTGAQCWAAPGECPAPSRPCAQLCGASIPASRSPCGSLSASRDLPAWSCSCRLPSLPNPWATIRRNHTQAEPLLGSASEGTPNYTEE